MVQALLLTVFLCSLVSVFSYICDDSPFGNCDDCCDLYTCCDGLNPGAYAGIGIAIFVVLCIIGIIVGCCRRSRTTVFTTGVPYMPQTNVLTVQSTQQQTSMAPPPYTPK